MSLYIVFTRSRPDRQRAWRVEAHTPGDARDHVRVHRLAYGGALPHSRLGVVRHTDACSRLRALALY